MNMRAGSRTWHGVSKGDKWYPCLAQVTQQGLSFSTVGMKRHIYRIAVIEAQAVVRRGLAERADRHGPAKCSGEEIFNPR